MFILMSWVYFYIYSYEETRQEVFNNFARMWEHVDTITGAYGVGVYTISGIRTHTIYLYLVISFN